METTTLREFNRIVKRFVRKHETAISVIITTTVVVAILNRSHREIDRFLIEKGLFDEFYTPEDVPQK
jgi:hypothetical protein